MATKKNGADKFAEYGKFDLDPNENKDRVTPVMEWVYIPPSDEDIEPTEFEGIAFEPPEKERTIPSNVVITQEVDESGYFGDTLDSDQEQTLLTPEEAFNSLANHLRNQTDSTLVSQVLSAKDARKDLIKAESRQQRIARIQEELDDLTREYEMDKESLDVFVPLRNQIKALDSFSAHYGNVSRNVSVVPPPAGDTDKTGGLRIYSTDSSKVLALENRVAAMERVVGPSLHVISEDGGGSVVSLLRSVREKLALLDEDARASLLKDMEDIPATFRMGGNSTRSAHVDQDTLDCVPETIARLRALKSLQDEAKTFVTNMKNTQKAFDHLQKDTQENRTLLETVRDNMEKNTDIMKNNIKALEKKLEAAKR